MRQACSIVYTRHRSRASALVEASFLQPASQPASHSGRQTTLTQMASAKLVWHSTTVLASPLRAPHLSFPLNQQKLLLLFLGQSSFGCKCAALHSLQDVLLWEAAAALATSHLSCHCKRPFWASAGGAH